MLYNNKFFKMPMGKAQPADERFWLFVDKNGRVNKDLSQCWRWLGGIIRGGYGSIRVGNKRMCSHRFSYALHHPITYDINNIKLCVCHKCDNRECCNPEHLFLGTNGDNSRDKVEKDRQAKGEKHGFAKLTETQVCEIREKYATGDTTIQKLAQEYGIHHSTIGRIINYILWKHI